MVVSEVRQVSLSQFYPSARQLFATAGISWLSGNYKVLVMANGYIPNFANANLSDIPAGQIIATSPNIANKTSVLGVLSGDTIAFGPIIDTRLAGSLIFYKDTGVPSTSSLVVYVDTPDISGMPQALVGFSYFVYQNIVGGWFRL